MSAKSHAFLRCRHTLAGGNSDGKLALPDLALVMQADCTQLSVHVLVAAGVELTSAKVRMASHSTTLQHQDTSHACYIFDASLAATWRPMHDCRPHMRAIMWVLHLLKHRMPPPAVSETSLQPAGRAKRLPSQVPAGLQSAAIAAEHTDTAVMRPIRHAQPVEDWLHSPQGC